jgi:Creatinase/Prolidase N-terminal domain
MKRGLVLFDPNETPPEEYKSRLGRLQERLRADRLACGFIYGDVASSGDICYLTNLTIYWNQGVLAVPDQGEPVFLTKLSKRVYPWMRSSSVVNDIRSNPDLGRAIVQFCREHLAGSASPKVALIDEAWWPESIVANVRAALPEVDFTNVEGAVRDQRAKPSQSELALLGRARSILEDAIDTALTGNHTTEERWAAVQRISRRRGFMDILGHCHANPEEGSVSVDVSGQFRHLWLRCAKARGGDAAARLQPALDAIAGSLKPGATRAEVQAAGARYAETARWQGFACDCLSHTDIETDGAQRPPAGADSEPLQDGEVVLLTCSASSARGTVALGDMFLVGDTGARTIANEAMRRE